MDNSYIGHYRLPVWAIIAIPLLTVGCGWTTWQIIHPAAYAALVAESGGPFGWIWSLPQPAVLAFFGFGTLMFGIGGLILAWAAITNKPSFAITAEGVKQFGILGRRDRFVAWDQIEQISRVRSVLMFTGTGPDGRRATVSVSMMGHKKAAVHAAILAHRPDFKPYL